MPETMNTPSSTNPGKGNILTKKIGPLPVFLWLGIGGLALYFYEKHKASTAAATAATTATTAPYPTGQNSPMVQGTANGGAGNGGTGNPSGAATPTPIATSATPGAPSGIVTTSGGAATGVSGGSTYSSGGAAIAGSSVPTVVNGVAMPTPTGTGAGTLPNAQQVAAASTIPYTPSPNASINPNTSPATQAEAAGINYAAIDALAGEGYPGGTKAA